MFRLKKPSEFPNQVFEIDAEAEGKEEVGTD